MTRLGRSPGYGRSGPRRVLRDGPLDPVQTSQSTLSSLDELWSVSDADIDRLSLLDPFAEGHGTSARTRSDGRDALSVLMDALGDGRAHASSLGIVMATSWSTVDTAGRWDPVDPEPADVPVAEPNPGLGPGRGESGECPDRMVEGPVVLWGACAALRRGRPCLEGP